jgi:predicted nucleotidyltransferase component of viral defense system
MLDINAHKFFLLQVLKEIYGDPELATSLGFKGGTALMLFHNLPRFSVDLDFNLIEEVDRQGVHNKIRKILSRHGDIRDEALKHFGLLLVLNYEKGNRNLKVEISNRVYPDEYELRDYLGISMKVMKLEHMFTHKLMAILDRSLLTHRDIFDCWFCMKNRTHLIKAILDMRLKCSFGEYMDKCISKVSKISETRILDGMGELLEPEMKRWIKADLIKEFVSLAEMYKAMPMTK